MGKRHILYVESSTGTIGGSMHSLWMLIKHLDRSQFTPRILIFEDNPFWNRFREAGVVVHVWADAAREGYARIPRRRVDSSPAAIPGPRSTVPAAEAYVRGSSLRRALASLLRFCLIDLPLGWRLAKLVEAERIDVVHANDRTGSNRFVILGALLSGRPVIQHERLVSPYRWTDVLLSRVADVTICASHAVARQVSDNGNRCRTVQVIPNSVEIADIRVEKNSHPRVGVVGRITEWKGQDLFLMAMKEIAAQIPQARFLLAGGVPAVSRGFERDLRKMAEEGPLAGRVTFAGHVDEPLPLIAGLDVLVVSTRTVEPFGRTLIEAMALGVPVVAPAVGGPAEIVQHMETGILYEPGDTRSLQQAVHRLLTDTELARRLAAAGREAVEQRYSPAAHARRIEAVYRQIPGRV